MGRYEGLRSLWVAMLQRMRNRRATRMRAAREPVETRSPSSPFADAGME